MTTFVLATANPDKAREIEEILGPIGVTLLPRPADVPEVIEDGETLEDNALLKARALVTATGRAATRTWWSRSCSRNPSSRCAARVSSRRRAPSRPRRPCGTTRCCMTGPHLSITPSLNDAVTYCACGWRLKMPDHCRLNSRSAMAAWSLAGEGAWAQRCRKSQAGAAERSKTSTSASTPALTFTSGSWSSSSASPAARW